MPLANSKAFFDRVRGADLLGPINNGRDGFAADSSPAV